MHVCPSTRCEAATMMMLNAAVFDQLFLHVYGRVANRLCVAPLQRRPVRRYQLHAPPTPRSPRVTQPVTATVAAGRVHSFSLACFLLPPSLVSADTPQPKPSGERDTNSTKNNNNNNNNNHSLQGAHRRRVTAGTAHPWHSDSIANKNNPTTPVLFAAAATPCRRHWTVQHT